jgi:hypothetical protein
VREALEFTYDYTKISKELVDSIEVAQEEDTKKQIVDQMLVPLYSLDPFEIFMKPPSIDNDINAENTLALINDIKDYSGPFLKKEESVNVLSICEEIESHLPEKIDIEEIVANHDVAERSKLLLK